MLEHIERLKAYDALKPMISSDKLNIKQVRAIGMKSCVWRPRSSKAP
jgi:hypothetical protein